MSGSLTRSSSTDIKREEKEDDENCSVIDKSEDEKKDGKMNRTGTRYLTASHALQHTTALVYIVGFIKGHS